MKEPTVVADARSPAPDIDANGVDREQIRAMLLLTPAQRLQKVEEFLAAALEIRNLNGPSSLR